MKKICVIDGCVGVDVDYKSKLEEYENHFEITYFKLEDMDIHSCVGCWACWLKTPGQCIVKDKQEKILETYIHADEVVFISNVKTGFITSKLKLTMDRLIPVVLPYIKIFKGEMHHYPRYEHAPKVHVLLYGDKTIKPSISTLVQDYFNRVVLNMNSTVVSFVESNDEGGIEDVMSHC